MRSLRREIRATLTLATPMIVTQVGQVAMFTTDVIMVGRLGPEALAAVGLGAALFNVVILCAMGVVMATGGLTAQAHGANDARTLGEVTGQGLLLSLFLVVPAGGVALFGEEILLATGQEPELAALAGDYLDALVWGIPTMLGFVALRSFFGAFNRPWPPFVAVLLTVPLNVVVDWLLIFGNLGFPALGVGGAGVATSFSATVSFLLLLTYALDHEEYRTYRILAHAGRLRPARIREIVAIGTPIGLALVVETGLFAAATAMMGWFDAAHVAAHQIAMQVTIIPFMVPLGIGQAATVRVGNEIGRGDMAAARMAGWTALGLGALFMLGSATVIWTVPEFLAGFFIDDGAEDGARVIGIAASFLVVAAFFQLVDGTQVIGGFALRGLNDTRVPLAFAVIGYWVLGFTSSYLLGFVFGFGGVGIWYGFIIGLGATAVLALLRFSWMTRPGAPRPPVVAPSRV